MDSKFSSHTKRLSHQDVVDLIIDRLASGIYPVGSKLPTSRDLAREIGVHRNTVAKAYRVVADLNLISMRQGRGTYVAALPDSDNRRPLSDQIEEAVTAIAIKAHRLGIPETELRRVVDEQIASAYHSEPPQAAFVECNDHDLAVAVNEIEMLTGIRLSPVRLDELVARPETARQFDVIFTSLFHITEVNDALKNSYPASAIVAVYTQPDENALTEIARIRPGSTVGIVVSNVEGGRRFVAQVNTFVEAETIVLVRPSDDDVRELAERVDIIVCSRSRATQVRSLDLPVPVVEISFHISKQSVHRITEALVHTPTLHREHGRSVHVATAG